MQNSENKRVLLPSVSIFNPELKVSENAWCLSFAKHSYQSKGEREHGFLVIQSPNKLYRRIYYDHNNPGFAKVLYDTRMWESDEEFPSQVSALIWKDENSDKPIGEVAHRTWHITKAQGLQLLEDVKKDLANPPRFFIKGDTSLLKEGELKKRCLDGVVSAVILGPISSIYGLLSAGLLRDASVGTWRSLESPIPPLAAKAGICVAAAVYSYALYEVVTDERYYSRQHNCATWCVEKLTNLNLPHISQDLDFQCTDLFAYVTGLHISIDEEDKNESRELLEKGIRHTINSVSPCLTTAAPTAGPSQCR